MGRPGKRRVRERHHDGLESKGILLASTKNNPAASLEDKENDPRHLTTLQGEEAERRGRVCLMRSGNQSIWRPHPHAYHQSENQLAEWASSYKPHEERVTFVKKAHHPSEEQVNNFIETSRRANLFNPSGPTKFNNNNNTAAAGEPQNVQSPSFRKEEWSCCQWLCLLILFILIGFCTILVVLYVFYPKTLYAWFGQESDVQKCLKEVKHVKNRVKELIQLLKDTHLVNFIVDSLCPRLNQIQYPELCKSLLDELHTTKQ